MPQDDIASQWKAFTPDQRDKAIARMTPDQKQQLASSLGYKAAPPAAETPITPRSLNERLTTPTSPEARAAHPVISAVSDFGGGAISGAEQLITSPIQTMKASGQMLGDLMTVAFPNGQPDEKLTASRQRLREQLAAAKANPAFTAGQLVGGLEAGEGVAKVGGKVADAALKVPERVTEAVTKTGPKVTKELVKGKTEANAAKVASETAGKTAEDTFSGLQARIETARNNALKIGNEKYNTVNEELSPLPTDMEKIHNLYNEAAGSLGEVQAQPALLNRLGKSVEHGEQLTYKDAQALYSELGKELSKGTLPGGTYHAFDVLHEGLGEEMQRIADAKGMGAHLTDARNYWRRMKQTFGRPLSATDSASGVLKAASPQLAEQTALTNRVRLLGSFDPEIPKTFEQMQQAQEAVKASPPPDPKATGKVGPEDIRAAKGASLEKRSESLKGSHSPIMSSIAIYDAIRSAIQGEYGRAALDIGARVIYGAGKQGLAKLLTQPNVVEFLTKPTARDIAQIPADLRGDLPAVIQAAQAKGIKVSPALLGAVMGSRNYPLGPNTKRLKQTSDELRANPQP